jgi:hypothetical protein
MKDLLLDDVGKFTARPMPPEMAGFLRVVTTFFGLHKACPFKSCRLANACATRNVVCYQAIEDHMKPIVNSIVARGWARRVDRGEEMDVAPARQGDMRRLLAWEEIEIARIKAGEHGDEDGLSAYQLFLRNLAST